MLVKIENPIEIHVYSGNRSKLRTFFRNERFSSFFTLILPRATRSVRSRLARGTAEPGGPFRN